MRAVRYPSNEDMRSGPAVREDRPPLLALGPYEPSYDGDLAHKPTWNVIRHFIVERTVHSTSIEQVYEVYNTVVRG